MHESAPGEATHGVDVWRVSVQEQLHAFADHWQHLDAGERQRASRYHNEADRQRYVISRGTLRALLGRRLQIEPARVILGSNGFGKPCVAAHHRIHFNTSHSGDRVVHGLSSATPLGVDVEALRPDPLVLEEFEQVLAPQEIDRLLSLPPARRSAAFMEVWVCKEAYVKAIGDGLNRTLRDICIGALEGGGYGLLHDRNPGGAGRAWTLVMLDLGPAYASCLAHPGPPRRLRIRDYTADPAAAAPRTAA